MVTTDFYYNTITRLEQQQIARDYITGWASGFLGNPKIEQQRITRGWEAGYADGSNQNTDHAENWKSEK